MSKVAIITDQHFDGRNSSLTFSNYFQRFYQEIFFPYLVANDIKTVICLGDTFDRRKYINFPLLERAKDYYFDMLRELGIKLVMVVGNHDISYKNTTKVNSPKLLLKEYDNIDIIWEKPEMRKFGNTEVLMIPWICESNKAESLKLIAESKTDIAMGHLELEGFCMYANGVAEEGLSRNLFHKYDMVFSGHYHHKSDDGQVYYLGAPYEMSWQDHDDVRGFHVFDTDTRELQHVVNTIHMFFKMEYDEDVINVDKYDYSQFAGKYCKIIVTNKKDLYKMDMFVQNIYEVGVVELKIIEDFLDRSEETLIDAHVKMEATEEVIANYIDNMSTDKSKEIIKRMMLGLYVESRDNLEEA